MVESKTALESLISGQIDCMELNCTEFSRERLLCKLNDLIVSFFPGSWTKGKFLADETDYLVYELSLINHDSSFSLVRLFDFGDKFKLVRL